MTNVSVGREKTFGEAAATGSRFPFGWISIWNVFLGTDGTPESGA